MVQRRGAEHAEDGGDATPAPPALPGYEVLGPLGASATSPLWRARRRADGLVVAVKVLRPAAGDVSAGLREAGLVARVRHRHVVHLYDALPLPDPVTGRPAAVALATQLAGGGSLTQVLARQRSLSAGELVTALQPVAGALADLHGTGVVHGDLSTGNVLFLRDGMPLLGDLGTARITGGRPGSSLGAATEAGMIAPEVVEGFPATPESDVYQLGALAWRCLAGAPPGPPDDRGELTEPAPDLPPGLADLLTRCMAREPEARPDAEEVALTLLTCAVPEPVEVAPEADPARGLTSQLRSQARADLDARPARPWPGNRGPHRRHRRRWDRAGSGSRRVRRARPRRAIGKGRVLVPAVLALACLLLLVLVASVAVVRPQPVDAQASDAARGRVAQDGRPEADPAAGSVGGPVPEDPGQGAAGSEPVRSEPVSPEPARPTSAADPTDEGMTEVLQVLLDARGEAWERADDAGLVAVVAPGSPAEASEAEQLARLRSSGARYPDVTFRVRDASVQGTGGGTEMGQEVLRLRATITRAALQGRGPAGERLPTLPVSTERVAVELVRVGERWLLWSWGPTSAG